MARLLAPLHSVGASGSLGALQFSTGLHGTSVGRKSTTSSRLTTARCRFRSSVADAHRLWESIHPSYQALWISRFGRDARAHFVGRFTRSRSIGPPLGFAYTQLPYGPDIPPPFTAIEFRRITNSFARVTWPPFFDYYLGVALYAHASYNRSSPPHPRQWQFLRFQPSTVGQCWAYFANRHMDVWLQARWVDVRMCEFLSPESFHSDMP